MLFELDPKIEAFSAHAYNTPLIQDVLKKYLWAKGGEKTPDDIYKRVSASIGSSPVENNPGDACEAFYEMLSKRLFIPGGRIMAGAGTDKVVTLMNCYVNATLEDSMKGIMDGVSNLALTSQQGGGMGTAFETLRPANAILQRTQSAASGVLPFMDVFSQTGKTIRSAGERRAAQMGTISDTHPDMPAFVIAKGDGLKDGSKRLSEFNVSVLISDAFMSAVDDDEDWPLYFSIPPVERDPLCIERDFIDDDGVHQYVYSVWKARDLWSLITRYTYEFSDPGVIFIDRVNDLNNLSYCETIRCTNPCGEQPLPPHGTCNLGALNLANVVRDPFQAGARIDFDLLAEVARWGVRFLDNVIDVTGYPLEEQRAEELAKRRIGLGIQGLGTMFAELGIKYGSGESVRVARQVMKCIALAAYDAGIELAKERGAFPLFNDEIIDCGFINARLDDERKERIAEHGLRFGVGLTIAPTGTTAIAFGCNGSAGSEPDFDYDVERRVRSKNTEQFDVYIEEAYTKRFYRFCTGRDDRPDYFVTAYELSVLEHIKVQAALQEWVDAGCSKTINIPVDMPIEEFVEVYDLSYQYGLKGCTTYRHSEWRESILRSASGGSSPVTAATTVAINQERPEVLEGSTQKLKWPSLSASMYVTINYHEGHPYEIFFASKDAKFQDWMTGLTLMISSIMRSGIDPSFIPTELKQVVSTHDTAWHEGKFVGSLVARIGGLIEKDFRAHGIISSDGESRNQEAQPVSKFSAVATNGRSGFRDICPSCGAPSLVRKEGCATCESCGYSKC